MQLLAVLVFLYTVYGFLSMSMKAYMFFKAMKRFKKYCNNVIYIFNTITTSKSGNIVMYYNEEEQSNLEDEYTFISHTSRMEYIPDNIETFINQ